MKGRRAGFALAAMSLGLMSAAANAVEGMSLEAGRGDGTNMVRVGIQWDWTNRWFQDENWHVGGYWDLALAHWHRSSPPRFNENITEIGLTPVFRLQRNHLLGPYVEAGIGAHLLSRTSLGDKRFSTAFQFGDHLGAGVRFGTGGAFELAYRFQHLSNAGIKHPNHGIHFHQIRFQHRF